MIKTATLATLALAMMTSAASALVVTNKTDAEANIGVDMGNTERVETIAAGGTVDLSKDCAAACGITGPWGYSRMVKTGEDFAFDKDGVVKSGS